PGWRGAGGAARGRRGGAVPGALRGVPRPAVVRPPGRSVLGRGGEFFGTEGDRVVVAGRVVGAGHAAGVRNAVGSCCAIGIGRGCPRADVLRWLPAALLLATVVLVLHLSRLHRSSVRRMSSPASPQPGGAIL